MQGYDVIGDVPLNNGTNIYCNQISYVQKVALILYHNPYF